MENQGNKTVVIMNNKSVGVSLILTFFFGPLGLLYSSIAGGLIMLVVSVILGIFTAGFSIILTTPICMIWGAISTKNYNERIISTTSNVI